MNIPLLLGTQLSGTALGDVLSGQNIAMVQAVLKENGVEQAVISKLWKPLLWFFVFISIAAILLGLLIVT